MTEQLDALVKKIMSSYEDADFSIDKYVKDYSLKERINFIAYLFVKIPPIAMEVIILKSSDFFKHWKLNEWKALVENMRDNAEISRWGLCIFFLKYTYQDASFIERIGIDLKEVFYDEKINIDNLKNRENQKAVDFVFKSLHLTSEQIRTIRHFAQGE